MSNVDLQDQTEYLRHIPVLLDTFLENLEPISGVWIDGTFGDGGYSRALLETDVSDLIAIDRDPDVNKTVESLALKYSSRISIILPIPRPRIRTLLISYCLILSFLNASENA